jgi:ATP-binding cassette subfamily F protein 3
MLENADCLILDEPTNHLDVAAREAVEAAVREFKGTLIAVTHDRYFLTHCVEKIYEIENGRLSIYDGNYDFFRQVKDGINEEGQAEKMTRSGGKPQPAPMQNRSRQKSDYRSEHKKPNQPKNTEKQKQHLAAQIELEIAELEGKLKELENLFDQTTPLEKYQEYDELLKEVDRLYHNWSELAT